MEQEQPEMSILRRVRGKSNFYSRLELQSATGLLGMAMASGRVG
jgi:hypothetical protein